ncbi:MAG: adenosylcobinamide-phosphate synthase CbiB [Hespellia sp.]|nr:adenosylcobinamide-phosphate synthase CbiB [Hespellia sp.]
MEWTLLTVLLGFLLDLILGDPRWLYHPVRAMGALISMMEKIIRCCLPKNKWGERAGGAILVLTVLFVSIGVPFFLLRLAYGIHVVCGIVLETFFCYQLLATKSLRDESMKVYAALEKENLPEARYAVSMIVGRDTNSLDEEGVTKAAVETIAENTADGVIAPLFYMMIGGAVGGFAYKAVNTMDSMVGYKNERYQCFGTVAAKLDDVANFIPARLAAVLMTAASFLLGMDGRNAWKIFCRDRYQHKSPNSAQTEAVMAGALDVELAGNAFYFGKLCEKPSIGDGLRRIEAEDIRRANRLLYGTAVLAVLVFGVLVSVLR